MKKKEKQQGTSKVTGSAKKKRPLTRREFEEALRKASRPADSRTASPSDSKKSGT